MVETGLQNIHAERRPLQINFVSTSENINPFAPQTSERHVIIMGRDIKKNIGRILDKLT